MRVAVVGGGVIGLMCAHYLCKRGVQVLVLDRGGMGSGCSGGNGGWICPSISTPLPSPRIARTSLRWLLRADSPLYIKPAAIPRLLNWLRQFWTHCNVDDYDRGTRALAALNRPTMELYDQLEASGVQFEMKRQGLLLLYRDENTLNDEVSLLDRLDYGPFDRLVGEEVHEVEPAVTQEFAGAIRVRPERHVRPETLCAGLASWLRSHGADLREGFEIRHVRADGSRVREVGGNAGTVSADYFVISTGAEAATLAAACGSSLPMQAGKGYSITVTAPRVRLRGPLYFADAKVAVTPYDGALRISGTMELSGINARVDSKRVAAVKSGALRHVPCIFDGERVTEWVGMRPLTVDGLPVIGCLPGSDNVFVATGHQMLGITLGPSTGQAVADLMVDGRSDIDLSPFDPARFSRS